MADEKKKKSAMDWLKETHHEFTDGRYYTPHRNLWHSLEQGRMELAEAFGSVWPGQNAIAKGIESTSPRIEVGEPEAKEPLKEEPKIKSPKIEPLMIEPPRLMIEGPKIEPPDFTP